MTRRKYETRSDGISSAIAWEIKPGSLPPSSLSNELDWQQVRRKQASKKQENKRRAMIFSFSIFPCLKCVDTRWGDAKDKIKDKEREQ